MTLEPGLTWVARLPLHLFRLATRNAATGPSVAGGARAAVAITATATLNGVGLGGVQSL